MLAMLQLLLALLPLVRANLGARINVAFTKTFEVPTTILAKVILVDIVVPVKHNDLAFGLQIINAFGILKVGLDFHSVRNNHRRRLWITWPCCHVPMGPIVRSNMVVFMIVVLVFVVVGAWNDSYHL